MRRYVIRDRATADRSAWFGNLIIFGTFVGAMVYVLRSGVPLPSSLPWWLLLVLIVLLAPTVVSIVAGLAMLVVRIPTLFLGEVVFRMGRRGLRMPEPVPWSEVVAIEVGPVEAEPATAYPDPGPKWRPRFAVTVAIGACSPAQTSAYAAARRVPAGGPPVADQLAAHDRWQAQWSATPQRVGFHTVVAHPADLDAIRAVARRHAPGVPVREVAQVSSAALEVPHRSVAALPGAPPE